MQNTNIVEQNRIENTVQDFCGDNESDGIDLTPEEIAAEEEAAKKAEAAADEAEACEMVEAVFNFVDGLCCDQTTKDAIWAAVRERAEQIAMYC